MIFYSIALTVCFLVLTFFTWKAFLALEKRISQLETNYVALDGSINKVNIPPSNMEDQVATGLVRGLQQMREDDANHLRLLELARRQQRSPGTVMNHTSAGNDVINTHGDLIPDNLTQEEKEVLRMYYEEP